MELSTQILENGGYEDHTIYQLANHLIPQAGRRRHSHQGHLPPSQSCQRPCLFVHVAFGLKNIGYALCTVGLS
jgi:hypothetical protein